jgi:hypothetical protein
MIGIPENYCLSRYGSKNKKPHRGAKGLSCNRAEAD